MKIVFFEIMPGEIDSLRQLLPTGHDYHFLETALSEETIEQAKDAVIISVFVKSNLTDVVLRKLPSCKLIVTRSMGFDHIAIETARSLHIQVRNVTTYASHPVAEFTFALLLAVTRRIYEAHHQLRDGVNFDIRALKGFNLVQKTIGVIGTGRIGKNVITIAQGFGMNIRAYDEHPDQGLIDAGIVYAPLDEVLRTSDVISIHVPHSESTHHLIGRGEFARMKKGVIFINTARGEIVDTLALLAALRDGTVWGAGLDVLEAERDLHEEHELANSHARSVDYELLSANHILMDMPNVIVTPHIAFETVEALQEIDRSTAESIQNFIENKAQQYL